MTFNQLKVGDIFDIEEKSGNIKYIKISKVFRRKYDEYTYMDDIFYNAVCIDEYSNKKGRMKLFNGNQSVSHINWS